MLNEVDAVPYCIICIVSAQVKPLNRPGKAFSPVSLSAGVCGCTLSSTVFAISFAINLSGLIRAAMCPEYLLLACYLSVMWDKETTMPVRAFFRRISVFYWFPRHISNALVRCIAEGE